MNTFSIFNIIVYIVGAIMAIAGIIGQSKSDDVMFFIGACTGLIIMILAIMMDKLNSLTLNTNATPNAE